MPSIFDLQFPVTCLVLVAMFVLYIYRSKPQAGPAAMGLGVASVTAIFLLGNMALSSLGEVFALSSTAPWLLIVCYLLMLLLLAMVAGYAASKTWEDTARMNTKLVMAFGFLPFLVIAMIFLWSLADWLVLAAVGLYFPAIWSGHLLFKHCAARQ